MGDSQKFHPIPPRASAVRPVACLVYAEGLTKLRAIQVSVLRCSALLGQTSQCTDSELALGGNNRNLVELLCTDLCHASPSGHNFFVVLTMF